MFKNFLTLAFTLSICAAYSQSEVKDHTEDLSGNEVKQTPVHISPIPAEIKNSQIPTPSKTEPAHEVIGNQAEDPNAGVVRTEVEHPPIGNAHPDPVQTNSLPGGVNDPQHRTSDSRTPNPPSSTSKDTPASHPNDGVVTPADPSHSNTPPPTPASTLPGH